MGKPLHGVFEWSGSDAFFFFLLRVVVFCVVLFVLFCFVLFLVLFFVFCFLSGCFLGGTVLDEIHFSFSVWNFWID